MTGAPAFRFVAPEYAGRVKPRDATWQHEQFRQMPGLIPPAGRPRRVVVTGFTRWGFWAKAKVYQWDYFAAFSRKLAALDIDTHFVWDEDGFDAAVTRDDTAVMHLFNEEKH